jgi:hypothetical protein
VVQAHPSVKLSCVIGDGESVSVMNERKHYYVAITPHTD